jgi:uncharacterized protein (TIRG00374 family)
VTLLIFILIYGPIKLYIIFISLPVVFAYFFLAAIGFHLMSFVFWSLRIKLLSKTNGFKISFVDSFITVISSLFAATITPGYVGGEPVRIKKLNDYGVPYGNATAIALGERGFDSIFFVMIFLIIIFSGLLILSGEMKTYTIIGLIVLVIFLSFLLLSIGANNLFKRGISWFEKIYLRIRKKDTGRDAVPKIIEQIEAYSGSTRKIFLQSPATLLLGIAVTSLLWLSDFMVPSMLIIGLGFRPDYIYIIFIQVILVLISLIPITPGAAGIMELLMIATFSIFLPHGYLIAFVIVWRFITFYLNIIIGSLAIHKVVTK